MPQLFRGRQVLLPGSDQLQPACIRVEDGIITEIKKGYKSMEDAGGFDEVIDANDFVLMPGVVDCHVHVNEPGRNDWEGFETATKAAAAGGITTIVDMPLNSIPSTTSCDAFKTKLKATDGKLYVDVGFWGGVVPGNENELKEMVEMGICGFKCFMIHSGVDEFQWTREEDIRAALEKLQGTDTVLMFHAEVDVEGLDTEAKGNPKKYNTFLNSRPDVMEVEAIKLVCKLCEEYKVPCHIVHLATADAIGAIQDCKRSGAPLTVETTHHYLTLAAEDIPDGACQFKCCPPIRKRKNQVALWEGVLNGDIDMVVSDHSPCTADLKLLESGDFIKAWGGIASVQFGLSLFWTNAKKRGVSLQDLHRLLTEKTVKLAGLWKQKGSIESGKHADFVIWNPEDKFTVTEDIIHHKNKLTPYMEKELYGVVNRTIVRGKTAYHKGSLTTPAQGQATFRK